MKPVNSLTAGIVGAIGAVAAAQLAQPAVSIGFGAVVTLVVFSRSGGYKRYALAGTLFSFSLAVFIYLGLTPSEYGQTPGVALTGFGLISGAIIVARSVFTKGAKKLGAVATDEETSKEVARAVSATTGTLAMAWAVLTAKKKAAQVSGVSGVGTITLVLNTLGVEIPIPVWFLESGLDANTVLFVGSVLVGFHMIESIHSTWRAAKRTAEVSRKGAKGAASKASDAASSVKDRFDSK